MPYLMGGFPDVEASCAIGEAYADAGADLVELGVPFSDPLADGPVIHAAGTRALAAGATLHDVLEVGARLARPASRWCSCATRTRCSRAAWSASPTSSRSAGISGLIVPDLPLEEAPARARGLRRRRDRARAARGADHARGAAGRDRRARPRVRLHGLGHRDDRRARGLAATRRELLARAKACTDVPVALGFGISTPEQAAAAADAGADGVIVGSRLVRAAAEAAGRGRPRWRAGRGAAPARRGSGRRR